MAYYVLVLVPKSKAALKEELLKEMKQKHREDA